MRHFGRAGQQEHKDINGGVQPLAEWLRGDIVHQIDLEECRLKRQCSKVQNAKA